MKGLIYKEFLITRKYYFMAYMYCMMFTVCFFLIRLSMICGNLADNEEVLVSLNRNLWIIRYFPCFCFLVAFCYDGGALFMDKDSGWTRYCHTTSLEAGTIVGAKMLSNLIAESVALVSGMIYLTAVSLCGGGQMKLSYIGNLLGIFAFILLISFIMMTLSYCVKKRQTVDLILCGAGGAAGVAFSAVLLNKMKSLEGNQDVDLFDIIFSIIKPIKDHAALIAAVLLIIGTIVSWVVSVRSLNRGEN